MHQSKNRQGEEFCISAGSFYKRNFRSILRSLVLSSLANLSFRKANNQLLGSTARIQFLCLHHLFSDEEDGFRNLLEYLLEQHQFLSYDKALMSLKHDEIESPSIVLSFDDGFKSCLRIAEILRDYGISACFFICPSVIGLHDYKKVATYCRDRLLVSPVPILDIHELEIVQGMGHEIGYHTWSHPKLSELKEARFQEEFENGRQILEGWVGPVKHFSWPFGKFGDIRPEVLTYVRSLGFESIASAERGCHLSASSFKEAGEIILRDPWVAAWPLSHLRYFMRKNILAAQRPTGDVP